MGDHLILLNGINESLKQIAENTKPPPTVDTSRNISEASLYAQLLGTVSGFHDWLNEALDENNMMKKMEKLHQIQEKCIGLRKLYDQNMKDAQKRMENDV